MEDGYSIPAKQQLHMVTLSQLSGDMADKYLCDKGQNTLKETTRQDRFSNLWKCSFSTLHFQYVKVSSFMIVVSCTPSGEADH